MSFKDYNGAPFRVGDRVLIAQRQSSSIWLVERIVEAIAEDGRPVLRKVFGSQKRKYLGGERAIAVVL